ncbi:MAG: prepilin-type N-terminal cleavage/methylation domain-containing protein [Planctomycetota bacterium]
MTAAPHRFRSPGFSLIEMVISLAVVSVLLVGMSSAIVLASRALPTQTTPASATVDTARALHQLRDDLRACTELLNRTATSVTLNLPDRDGDGQPEVITYAWADTAGAPLTRTVNSGSAIPVLEPVQAFTLTYSTLDLARVFPGATTQSAEVLLSSYDTSEVNDAQGSNLDNNQLLAAQITPILPSQATSYHVTRALVYAQAGGSATGQYFAQIRPMDGNEPSATVTESVTMRESNLTSSFDWSETVFAPAGPFASGEDFALVFEQESGGDAGQFRYDNTATKNLIRSNDGGQNWTYSNNDRLVHFVYGTYEETGDDWTYTQAYLTAITVDLVHGDANGTTHHLTVPLANTPMAVDGIWIADFNADPTALDRDGDGSAEWQGNPTFNAAGLTGSGAWTVDDTLQLTESSALTTPARLEAWLQDTTDNSLGGGIEFRVDNDGSREAAFVVGVSLTAGQQTVSLYSKDSGGTLSTLAKHIAASTEVLHIALTADPGNNQVAFEVDGTIIGSYAYVPDSGLTYTYIQPYLASGETGIRFEHLRLSTGGSVTVNP